MIEITPFSKDDLLQLPPLQPESWDDITPSFKFYLLQKFCYPFAAKSNGHLAGVATAIVNDQSGWLAHIIVHEDFRRQGIGAKLTRQLLDLLEARKCVTKLLIATKDGEPLYRTFGFHTIAEYNFYHAKKLNVQPDPHIEQIKKSDIKAIMELDKEKTMEDRSQMLLPFHATGWVYRKEDGEISGFYLPDCGEGVIVAKDDKTGIDLLQFKHTVLHKKAVLPATNQTGNDYLQQCGFVKFSSSPRMVLGEDITWQPQAIFSRIGGYYG